MNNDQEQDRGEFAPVQIDVLCPCCRNHFEQDSEQAICVESFGECIFCRFSPNSKGSKSGTQAELSEIVVKQEVKRRFKKQQPKTIDMDKFVDGPVVIKDDLEDVVRQAVWDTATKAELPEEIDIKHKKKYYALLKEYDRVCYLLDKANENENNIKSAYQRGYLDGIGRNCPNCSDYKAMYIKVRDELAAEQQLTERQTARIVELQEHIENFDGEDR